MKERVERVREDEEEGRKGGKAANREKRRH